SHFEDLGARLLENCQASGITVLGFNECRYPALLAEINSPPPLLFVKGDATLLTLPQMAVVGSRRASRGGTENARQFAASLAAHGFVVTSGMALGIDGAAHGGAMISG